MKTRPKKTLFKKVLTVSTCFLVVGLAALYVGFSLWIGSDVRQTVRAAMAQYEGDNVLALMAFVKSPDHSLRERNHAVWALGQLGDRRALPTLVALHTGEPCEHDSDLCQRELGKAIELIEGGMNLTALVWR